MMVADAKLIDDFNVFPRISDESKELVPFAENIPYKIQYNYVLFYYVTYLFICNKLLNKTASWYCLLKRMKNIFFNTSRGS